MGKFEPSHLMLVTMNLHAMYSLPAIYTPREAPACLETLEFNQLVTKRQSPRNPTEFTYDVSPLGREVLLYLTERDGLLK